jgi:uncharacterized repeat protein (TIGR03803 family)
MRSEKFLTGVARSSALLALLALVLSGIGALATAQEITVLHSFDENGKDGYQPRASLIADAAGNLYGTTSVGGSNAGCLAGIGCGTVFELSPAAGGGWTEKILHNFNDNGRDGYSPFPSLIFDSAGNLYGTTYFGGIYYYGMVFELSPKPNGEWEERSLHSFNNNGKDGQDPYGGLVFDADGNLYGTTVYGGAYFQGTVFELSRNVRGGWRERVLHSFGQGTDGGFPYAGVIVDAKGNVYGTTITGGSTTGCLGLAGCGTVFELSPTTSPRVWTEKVLCRFTGNGELGAVPYAGLIFDASGNLYGTTSQGGTGTLGTVFELSPMPGGDWVENVLHNFSGTDGIGPYAGLIFDPSGNLYGTTTGGGAYGHGTVFELAHSAGGTWTEIVLVSFTGGMGYVPQGGLIFDSAGNLYGTTIDGGVSADGTVFKLTP